MCSIGYLASPIFLNFTQVSEDPKNGQIKNYRPLKMGPGDFLWLWGISLGLKLKKKIKKFLGARFAYIEPNPGRVALITAMINASIGPS